MKKIIFTCMVLILLIVATNTYGAETGRTLRSAGSPVVMPRYLEADEDTLLKFNELDDLGWFFTDPNDYGDKWFNVWFTPPYDDYQILEVHIPLFDMQYDDSPSLIGKPGMKVLIWLSREIENELGQYPNEDELIDTIVVPYDSLIFSNDTLRPNIIDLRDLNIIHGQPLDFHIGVEVVYSDTTETDTLAVYHDWDAVDDTCRSSLMDSEGEWILTQDIELQGETHKFNFGIWVVITNDYEAAPLILGPDGSVRAYDVDAPYPNPFNKGTRIKFWVRPGLPYSAVLFDHLGRKIQKVEEGIGFGSGLMIINGDNLATGSYFLRVYVGNMSTTQRLVYMR